MAGAIQLSSDDFPGYAAAVARENLVRAAACLGMAETVCGLPVAPLTLRRARMLALASSPFLLKSIPPELLMTKPGLAADIKNFFWFTSEKFQPGRPDLAERYYRRQVQPMIRIGLRHVSAEKVLEKICREILVYVEEAYLDAPATDNDKSYYASEIGLASWLHKNYGLPIDFWKTGFWRKLYRQITGQISAVDVPLKIIWQLQKVEREANDPKALLRNPSDKILADGLAAMNQRQRRLREYEQELATQPAPTFTGTNPPPDLSGKEYDV